MKGGGREEGSKSERSRLYSPFRRRGNAMPEAARLTGWRDCQSTGADGHLGSDKGLVCVCLTMSVVTAI
jgi:hypothetical protein